MTGELDLEYEFRPSPTSANWLSAPLTGSAGAGVIGAKVTPSWTKPISECTTEKECVDNHGYWYQDYGMFNEFYKQADYCHGTPIAFYQHPVGQVVLMAGAISAVAVLGWFLYKKA